MERVLFPNSRNTILSGHLYPSPSKSIIIMAHGLAPDSCSKGRFERLARRFNYSGFSVLMFDFCECEKSWDDGLTVCKDVDDLFSAIKFAKSRGYQKVALFGYSLGNLICLKCYTPEIEAMVLSGAMHYDWGEYFTKEEMLKLQEKGAIAVKKEEDESNKIIVDQRMLGDFAEISQANLLKRVTCPVLLVHGINEEDEEELVLAERSKRARQYLSSDSKLEIIHRAAQGLTGDMETLSDLANDWFLKHLQNESSLLTPTR